MTLSLRKTMVIGLGGTGIKSILNMKREFYDALGASKIPPVVELVGIDTDNPKKDLSVSFAGNEFVYAKVPDPQAILDTFPVIKNDFPDDKVRLRALLQGAGQVRACGRLAVLANANAIYEHIESAYKNVISARAKDEVAESPDYNLSMDPCVTAYVVCSLAGGTGSGAFLDIGYMCKEIMGKNDRVIGIFLLPSVFSSFPVTDYIEGNTYAALKELDYLMDRADKRTETDVVDYGGGKTIDWAAYQPFDQVYLIDNQNEKDVLFNDLDQILRFIGRALYVNTNVVAEENEDIMDNIAGAQATEEPWDDKYPYYAGMGAAAIELPIDKIVELGVYKRMGRLILEDFLTSDKSKIEEEVRQFARDKRFAEQGENIDFVIDAILDPTAVMEPTLLEEPSRLPNPETAIPDWRDREIRGFAERYRQIASENLQAKLEDARNVVSEHVRSTIARRVGGIDYMRAFVRDLLAQLRADQQAMESERQTHETRRKATQNEYPSREAIAKACSGIWAKPKVDRIVARIESSLRAESLHLLEIIRREFAIDFFAELISLCEQFQETIETVHRKLEKVSSIIAQRIGEVQKRQGPNSFTKYLDDDSLDHDISVIDSHVAGASVLDALRTRGESPLAWAAPEYDAAMILGQLREIVQPHYEPLREQGMDGVLDKLSSTSREKLDKYLGEFLIERATPLWKPSPVTDRKGLTRIFVFGVNDSEQSILHKVGTDEFGVDATRCKFASTGNNYSISAFQYKLKIPAFLVGGVEEFKIDYEEREKRPRFTHHIRKRWADSPEILGDLFPDKPAAGTQEQMLYWSICHAEPFGFIRRKGNHYSIQAESFGGMAVDDYWVNLAHGRRNAFEQFVKQTQSDTSRLAEIKHKVESVLTNSGYPAVAKSLEEYAEKLKDEAIHVTDPDVKELLELELQHVADFQTGLTTIT